MERDIPLVPLDTVLDIISNDSNLLSTSINTILSNAGTTAKAAIVLSKSSSGNPCLSMPKNPLYNYLISLSDADVRVLYVIVLLRRELTNPAFDTSSPNTQLQSLIKQCHQMDKMEQIFKIEELRRYLL